MPKQSAQLKLIHVKPACENCKVRRLCLPTSLDGIRLSQMGDLVKRCRPLRKGEFLYRAGDPFDSLYAVRYGALKTYGITADGKEQVTGFHIAGEVVGMDAIYSEIHPCNAVTLQDTEVCRLPYEDLEALVSRVPDLRKDFSRLMSREILREEHMLMLLGSATAEQRLARFLLNLSTRICERGGRCDEVQLFMTRQEIGNYLGIALETVSRQFTLLQERGLIGIDNRMVRMLDREGLMAMAAN